MDVEHFYPGVRTVQKVESTSGGRDHEGEVQRITLRDSSETFVYNEEGAHIEALGELKDAKVQHVRLKGNAINTSLPQRLMDCFDISLAALCWRPHAKMPIEMRPFMSRWIQWSISRTSPFSAGVQAFWQVCAQRNPLAIAAKQSPRSGTDSPRSVDRSVQKGDG
jgi:hypothetical protein